MTGFIELQAVSACLSSAALRDSPLYNHLRQAYNFQALASRIKLVWSRGIREPFLLTQEVENMLWRQTNKSAPGVLLAFGGLWRVVFPLSLAVAVWAFLAGQKFLPVLLAAAAALVLWLYRSPGRLVPEAAPILASPVDGRIDEIERNTEEGGTVIRYGRHWRDPRILRSPVTGPVKALRPDGTLVISDSVGKEILLRPAGRNSGVLVLGPSPGDEVELGAVIGFWSAGRSLELVIPDESGFEVIARRGEKSLGGQTIVAVRRDTRAQNVFLETS